MNKLRICVTCMTLLSVLICVYVHTFHTSTLKENTVLTYERIFNIKTVSSRTIANFAGVDNILSFVHGMEKPLLVTLINNAYIPFAYSWLCNTKEMDIHKQVLIISTDEKTKIILKEDWPEVNIAVLSDLSTSGDQVYSHAGYVRLIIYRARILLELLKSNFEILLFEMDCVWLKNPVPFLSKQFGYDMLVNQVAGNKGKIAGGFIYLFPTNTTRLLWNKLTDKLSTLEQKIQNLPASSSISKEENDQVYLSNLVANRYGGLKAKTLPIENFADGKWYTWTHEKRASLDPFIINNNWVEGNKNKILKAKKWGHWFIKDSISCDMEQVKKIISSS